MMDYMSIFVVGHHLNKINTILSMNDKFQDKYRIRSARAMWHDYNDGLYFITVCTKDHTCYFGHVVDGEMRDNELGLYVAENLKNATSHYSYCEIPLFVVMPNHIHIIVVIGIDKALQIRCNHSDVARRVSTGEIDFGILTQTDIANSQSRLSALVGGLKSATTRYARQNNIDFAWQARFYDHIIRDHDECNQIAEYIEDNPNKWELDKFFVK